MIFTERTITVVNDSATINKPLILYRGDKNIELKITIAESQFKFRNTDASNVIETTDASYAQLVINTPYNSPIFSDVAVTKNGAVIFVITEAMIDEIREVGAYEIQIRLLDDNKQSRASIPPVSNAIEIREPIAIEDGSAVDSNAVNAAKVNRALTTTSAPLEAFDSQGNYIKNNWGDGDPITDAALNKMEAGIDGVNKKIGNVRSQIKDIATNKADKNSVFTMANMGQDIKEAMTGGSVAVVGKNTILTENIVDGQVTRSKFNNNIFEKNYIKISNMIMNDNHIRFVMLLDINNIGNNNIALSLGSNDVDINILQISFFESDNATLNTSDSTQIDYVNPDSNNATFLKDLNLTKRYLKIFVSFTTYFDQKTIINFDSFGLKINGLYKSIEQIGQWADMAVNTFNIDYINEDDNLVLISKNEFEDYKIENENKLNNLNVVNPVIIEVGTGKQYTNLTNAIKSIATSENNNKASKTNPYVVYIYDGEYELYNDLDLSNIQDQTLYKRGLEIPDYVSLIGIGNVTVKCTLPASEADHAERVQAISTINTYGENYFENITFIAKNCRYCVHDDGGGEYKNRKIEFVNCTFKHLGNDIGQWAEISQECYGSGYTGGRKGVFKNCIFEAEKGIPFYCHTSSQWYMTSPFTLEINNCAFISKCGISIRLNGVYGADKKNRCTINNSYINQNIEIDDLNNEIILFGGGNSKVTVTNNQTTPQVYLINNMN